MQVPTWTASDPRIIVSSSGHSPVYSSKPGSSLLASTLFSILGQPSSPMPGFTTPSSSQLPPVCEFIIAIIGSATSASNQSAQSTLVAFVCFYIAFFASTWGPITWVVTGEIFPLQIRAKAMSLSVASNWLWNWAIAYTSEYFPYSGACSRHSYLFCSAVHGRLWPRKRKLGYEGVLHLGHDVFLLYHLCILLHSRDKGSLS